jgi:hypothetical protein
MRSSREDATQDGLKDLLREVLVEMRRRETQIT